MQMAAALLAAQNLGRHNPSLATSFFRRLRPGDEGDDTSGKSLVGVLSQLLCVVEAVRMGCKRSQAPLAERAVV
jgi:hypothetical protein